MRQENLQFSVEETERDKKYEKTHIIKILEVFCFNYYEKELKKINIKHIFGN